MTLTSEPAIAGGGQAVFYTAPDAESQESLALELPEDGSWVEFSIGGSFGQPSIEDKDCLLKVAGDQTAELALMVRVRKNANTLTVAERDRFLGAWGALNAAGNGSFQDFRDMHVSSASPQEHGGPHFLPWHRTYLLDLERQMQLFDPSVALHYWRFDEPAPQVFRANFMGATAQQDTATTVNFDGANPLSTWVTDGTPGIQRSASFDTQASAAPGLPQSGFPLLDQLDTLGLGPTYSEFAVMEGTPHGAAHVSFQGYVSSIPTAPKDPLFFMLHANVDRLWALWQWFNERHDPNDFSTYAGQDLDGRRPGDTTWPWNGVVTPPRPDFAPRAATGPDTGGLAPSSATPAPGNTPTIASVIDYQGVTSPLAQVGFGYDVVPYEPTGLEPAMSEIDDLRQQLEAELAARSAPAPEAAWTAGIESVGGQDHLGAALGDDTDRERLEALLADREASSDLRIAAFAELVNRHDGFDSSHERSLALLTDDQEDNGLRLAALRALRAAAIHSPTQADWQPDFLDALRGATSSGDDALRLEAFQTLTSLGDRVAQESLIDGLENPDQSAVPVAEALRMLADDPHSRAREVATGLITSDDPMVKIEAIRVLAGDPDSASLFRGVVLDTGEPAAARKLAATALANLDPEELRSATQELADNAAIGVGPEAVPEPVSPPAEEVNRHLDTLLRYLE